MHRAEGGVPLVPAAPSGRTPLQLDAGCRPGRFKQTQGPRRSVCVAELHMEPMILGLRGGFSFPASPKDCPLNNADGRKRASRCGCRGPG